MILRNIFITIISLTLTSSFNCMAQDDSTPPEDTHPKSPSEVLSQFSLGSALGGESASVPKVGLKTYKFTALIGKAEWDFYLYNSVPVLSISAADSEKYFRNDLVSQLGGLLNVSLGRTGYFGNKDNPDMQDIKGVRYEFKAGGKAVDVLESESGNKSIVPVLQSTLDISYLIPLFKSAPKGETISWNRDDMIGNLSLRFIGAIQYVADTKVYDDYYTSRRGNRPDPLLFSGTFDLFFYITDQVYIKAGYTFTNQTTIDAVPFLAITYGKL